MSGKAEIGFNDKAEDERDAEIARIRLAAIADGTERLVRGKELSDWLERLKA